jgi:ribosomal protein S12 methylthiotransferase
VNLVTLLKALDRLRGDFRVRVLYSYPSEITDEFLDWMRTSPRAVRYVDVPLQHTDPDILKAMARVTAVKATQEAAERIRAAVPGVTLRTTVMTGFPGETAAAFRRMLSDLKRMRFDHLGVFAYSPEDGTAAAKMDGRPPAKVAESRALKIMAVQKRIWEKKAAAMVGQTFKALVVAPGIARLESQAPDVDGVVRLDGAASTHLVGTFVIVRLIKSLGYDFLGAMVPASG